EASVQARERAGEAADPVAHHPVTEGGIAFQVLVGIDNDVIDLRREAREHVLDHRSSVQRLQSLVDAAHATPEAAGEDDAAHVHSRILRLSLQPMNNNRWLAPFINLGHFVDHLAMLVFPTVVLALAREWLRPYSELL